MSFQKCFDSWDLFEGRYYESFGSRSLTAAQFEAIYGRFYIRNNGTSRSNAQINSRVETSTHEHSRTRTRTLTLFSGEIRSLTNVIRYLRSGYPLAVSYYIIFCYSEIDCWSTSVFDIENLPLPGSFAAQDVNNKMERYNTITNTPCKDRSISIVLRELL